jgi:hypothetical protein
MTLDERIEKIIEMKKSEINYYYNYVIGLSITLGLGGFILNQTTDDPTYLKMSEWMLVAAVIGSGGNLIIGRYLEWCLKDYKKRVGYDK